MEITPTAERTTSIRSIRVVAALCLRCKKLAQWAVLEQTAILTGMGAHEVYHLLNARKIHFVETGEGFLLICLDSIGKNNRTSSEAAIEANGKGIRSTRDPEQTLKD
jgi:hypothetical protein